jgi:L-asparaginase
VFFHRRPFAREHISTDRIEPRVAYIKTVMGSDSFLIDAVVDAGVRGLVLEAFGGGEVTPFMCAGIERAVRSGLEIVVATRCFRGRPLDLYADEGEGRWLADHGVRFAGTLTGPKARVKLMLALGRDDAKDLDRLFL